MLDPQLIDAGVIMERMEILPPELLVGVNDPKNMDIVALVCADHHLNDPDRVQMVQQLTALVLMGFVHDYDLGREINDKLELHNPKLGNSLADAISAKMFAPIKELIAKNYRPVAPLPKPEEKPAPPRIVADVTPQPAPLAPVVPRPMPQVPAAPSTMPKIIAAQTPIPPRPAETPAKQARGGTSYPFTPPAPAKNVANASVDQKTTEAKYSAGPLLPGAKPMGAPMNLRQPTGFGAAVKGPPSTAQNATGLGGVASAPANTSAARPATLTPSVPLATPEVKTTQPSGSSAPFIMHAESEFKPVQSATPNFRLDILEKKSFGGATSMFGGSPTKQVSPPVAAKVQFGSNTPTEPKKSVIAHTEFTPPRTVHYTESSPASSGTTFGASSSSVQTSGGGTPPFAQTPIFTNPSADKPVTPARDMPKTMPTQGGTPFGAPTTPPPPIAAKPSPFSLGNMTAPKVPAPPAADPSAQPAPLGAPIAPLRTTKIPIAPLSPQPTRQTPASPYMTSQSQPARAPASEFSAGEPPKAAEAEATTIPSLITDIKIPKQINYGEPAGPTKPAEEEKMIQLPS